MSRTIAPLAPSFTMACPRVHVVWYYRLLRGMRKEQQRAGTRAALDTLSDEALSKPAPDSIRYLGPTVGPVFAGESAQWLMHAGQRAVVRRKFGRPPLF